MITRIVKIHLQEDFLKDFAQAFILSKPVILSFPGSISVELLQDSVQTNIVFTHSKWQTIDDLENYRNSAFFLKTWKHVKPMFAQKAEAWSIHDYFEKNSV
jgi:heme-degrading monooxygenase HmoA